MSQKGFAYRESDTCHKSSTRRDERPDEGLGRERVNGVLSAAWTARITRAWRTARALIAEMAEARSGRGLGQIRQKSLACRPR